MATIDTNVPIELDVESMRAGEPNSDELRALFTELEFTSLLKELLPVVEVSETHYTEAKSAADVESVVSAVAAEGALAVAVEQEEAAAAPEEEEKEARAAGRANVVHGEHGERRSKLLPSPLRGALRSQLRRDRP